MAAKVFISYSHRDEKALERLHKHLVMLRRDGLIETWHDRQIKAGEALDNAISKELERCDLFLALVSPDYLDSKYCYEKEMQRAIKRAEEGTLIIVPIILEPCDWQSSPLAKFKAVPKDGHPVTLWTNENVAWFDVVKEIREALGDPPVVASPEITPEAPTKARYKIKKDFDTIDKAEFRDQGFSVIRDFFKRSTDEVNTIGEPLKARFEDMSATAFTCTLVNRTKRGGESHITVHNVKAQGYGGDIVSVHEPHANKTNSYNGSFAVDADEYSMYFSGHMMVMYGRGEEKMSAEQVANHLWAEFIERAGVEHA
jgi:hypothetical protein